MVETIKGMKELQKKFEKIGNLAGAKRGLKGGALHIKGKINKYPRKTAANIEKAHGRWYERGWGSKYKRLDGAITGKKTSKTLSKQWTTEARNRGLMQVIGNNVSYAPYVHDPSKQARIHGQRGWKTTDEVLKSQSELVVAFIQQEIEKDLT